MKRWTATAVALCLLACGAGESDETDPGAGGRSADISTRPANIASGDRPKVVFFGDSLTAGLALEVEEAFPARLGELLAEDGRPIEVVNAGVSGDTTAGGLARLDWILQQEPDIVVVQLGANDGLRGLDPRATEANLRAILERVQAVDARPLLLGMKLPPSYGPAYVAAFEQVFPRLAEELDVPYVPFFLDGIAGRPELHLADGIHPSAAGHVRAAENLLPHLRSLLEATERIPQNPSPN